MRDDGVWWRIAWRNLWRHPARTLITGSALAFGYAAAVVMIGMADGMVAQMVENGTDLVTGQLQIHAADYRPERSLFVTIGGAEGTDVGDLVARVEGAPGVHAAAPRVYGGGLLSSGDETVAAALLGIDPELEPEVTRLLSTLTLGRAPRVGHRELAVGKEIARRLGVEPGDELVVVAGAADGSMGNDLFTVVGVFESGLAPVDASQALMPLPELQTLLALEPERIHEVAASMDDVWKARDAAEALVTELRASEVPLDAVPWTEFRTELATFAQLAGAANAIIVAIIFMMAIFGVANTMLIGTYERRREFAVIRALGTPKHGVGRMVIFEGIVLGVFALAVGVAITVPLFAWMAENPVDLSRFFGDVSTLGSVIRPTVRLDYSWSGPIVSALGLLATALLAAAYPAYRAVRVPPADALANR